MRSESSALSLHHIKTTVFTVVLVLPCISEPAERTGIGTTERRPSISSRDSKSRHVCVCFLVLPYSSEHAERTGIGLYQQPFDSPLGVKKRLSYSVVLVLPCISELAERSGIGTTERRPSISSRDNKSRHKCVCFLVLPTGIEPITNP